MLEPGKGCMGWGTWGEVVGTMAVRYEVFVDGSRQGREVMSDGWEGVDMPLVKADWWGAEGGRNF